MTASSGPSFDFWLPDGSLGGFCWLDSAGGYVAGLVGEGRPYVLVKDLDVRPAQGWEVRAEGLWAVFHHESEGHWSWGLEAFGVAFDDPEEAVRTEWGDRTALGFDLEWEAPDVVHGEILVGPSERIAFDGRGGLIAESVAERAITRPNGFAAPVRLAGGRVLDQWLDPAVGWVRAWRSGGSGTGTG